MESEFVVVPMHEQSLRTYASSVRAIFLLFLLPNFDYEKGLLLLDVA